MANSKKLIKYTGTLTKVEVPTSVDNIMVRAIKSDAFSDSDAHTVILDTYANDIDVSAVTDVQVVWNKEPKCTVSFNSNGGSGSMDARDANIGLAYKIPECTFTAPTNKSFSKWAIGSSMGTQIEAGSNYAFSENTTLYAIWKWDIEPNRVGGRIFYINPDATGATYTFYDSDMNVLSDQTVAGLENAYYYMVDGTGSADKFYAYDNINGIQSGLSWACYPTVGELGCSTNTIGSGKPNSAKAIAAYGEHADALWHTVKYTLNAASVGGCNDWYIGSQVELEQLRLSGLVDTWFGYQQHLIWSSCEYSGNPSTRALYWNKWSLNWSNDNKGNWYDFFGIRSF